MSTATELPKASTTKPWNLLRRQGWLITATILFISATILAYWQEPWPESKEATSWWRWLLAPRCKNFFLTQPFFGGPIKDMGWSDSSHAWILTNAEKLLFSSDMGKTWDWEKIELPNTSTEAITFNSRPTTSWSHAFFLSPKEGWVADQEGNIVKTEDRGKTWKVITSSIPNIFAMGFTSSLQGWLLLKSNDQTELRTTIDGGVTWENKVPSLNPKAGEISKYHDLDHGFLAAESSNGISISKDSGATWTFSQNSTGQSFLKNGIIRGFDSSMIAFGQIYEFSLDALISTQGSLENYWALQRDSALAGSKDQIWQTNNGGKTWSPIKSFGTRVPMLVKSSGGSSLALTNDLEMFITTYGSMDWKRISKPVFANLVAIPKSLSQYFAVSMKGEIWESLDGGVIWNYKPTFPQLESYLGLALLDRNTWQILDKNGVHYVTTNGGKTWEKGQFVSKGDLNQITADRDGGVHIITVNFPKKDAQVNSYENISTTNSSETTLSHYTQNSDGTWKQIPTQNPLGEKIGVSPYSFFLNENEGWMGDEKGQIYSTRDGGFKWEGPFKAGSSERITWISFENDQKGYCTNFSGKLLETIDGGKKWASAKTWVGDSLSVAAWSLSRGENGILIERDGTVSGFKDGKTLSLPLNFPGQSMPIWYYLSLIPLLGMLWLWKKKVEEPPPLPQEELQTVLFTDKPWTPGQPDYLQFNGIASGITRFLRNSATEPPLTIAITGAWGSGKSSLMEMVRDQVQNYGFHPVWFNAWHHQKEESLLAALIESIRQESTPLWYSRDGLAFRWRLLYVRLPKAWPKMIFAVLLLALAIYFASEVNGKLSEIIRTSTTSAELKTKIMGLVDTYFMDKLKQSILLPLLAFLAIPAAIVFNLVGLHRLFTAFGLNSADLIASVARRAKPQDLQAQTSFRHRFAREFNEVTTALDKHSLLIFVDDLDRCKPETVVDMLEASNFLASSGKVVIVLAMDRERVMRCVASNYKEQLDEVEEELVEDEDPGESSPRGNKNLSSSISKAPLFATRYLEKIINIEVPIPKLDPQLAENLLAKSLPKMPPPLPSKHPRLNQVFEKSKSGFALLRKLGPLLCATILAALILALIWVSKEKDKTTPKISGVDMPQSSSKAETKPAPKPEDSQPSAILIDPQNPPSSESFSGKLDYKEGISATVDYSALFWGAILFLSLLSVLRWLATHPADSPPKDSERFVQALRAWSEVIHAVCSTPRALKRFENRVRFLAMQLRHHEDHQPIWEKWFEGPSKISSENRSSIPDEVLVALAAMDLQHPGRLNVKALRSLSAEIHNRNILEQDLYRESSLMQADASGRTKLERDYFAAYKKVTGPLGFE